MKRSLILLSAALPPISGGRTQTPAAQPQGALGHTSEEWDDLDVIKMYPEVIKWVLGRTGGSVAPHP